MSASSFKPIRLRMERASEHARALNTEVKAFFETDPYKLVHEFKPDASQEDLPPDVDPSNGIHLYRVEALPVPDRISILAGDILRDLRSALDYLTWQLALVQSDSPPQMTAFPIFKSKALYERDRLRFIGGIDPTIHSRFEVIQPYHAGDNAADHVLWVLHRLANDYKHRLPRVVGSLPYGAKVERPEGVDLFSGMRVGPFNEDDIVLTTGIIRGIAPETELDLEASFAVAFSDGGGAIRPPLVMEIDQIGIEVDKTIKFFREFLPE